MHAVNIAYTLPWFREFLNQSHLTFCDGIGIKLAANITGQPLHYRFTPPDFIDHICEIVVRSGWRIFFLGAKPGVALRAAGRLSAKFPSLQIATHHGYFNMSSDGPENKLVIEQINQFRPQILVLGFGMPLQEKWSVENLASLHANIVFPAGAMFDYLSGELPRAPSWMTDHGFEWLGRLMIEPRRLWRRYIIGNPLFFWRLFIHHLLRFPLPE
jgi:N-acetylglucosaminyldiphosphoundecaprenol N-acetyl-beta-D-mannosaminyltransferase